MHEIKEKTDLKRYNEIYVKKRIAKELQDKFAKRREKSQLKNQ
jgi:hypothetical protein